MKRFQAIVHFEMDEEFMSLIAPHRTYINYLINNIFYYCSRYL